LTESSITRLLVDSEIDITSLRTWCSGIELPTDARRSVVRAVAVVRSSSSLELISRVCSPGATYR
jgi:hypothetical protein